MARPRSVSDDHILDATLQLLLRQGSASLTLAAVGKAAGLAAATLVQRFASRDALIRAALERAWDGLDAATADADAREAEDFDGALAVLAALSPTPAAAADYVDGLLLLREDLTDPVLRARGVAWLETLALALGRRLTADPQARRPLGRLMVCQWQGAQIWWAFGRRGDPVEFITAQLRQWHAALRI